MFICETKKAKGFKGTVCRKLNFGERGTVRDPVGKKGVGGLEGKCASKDHK